MFERERISFSENPSLRQHIIDQAEVSAPVDIQKFPLFQSKEAIHDLLTLHAAVSRAAFFEPVEEKAEIERVYSDVAYEVFSVGSQVLVKDKTAKEAQYTFLSSVSTSSYDIEQKVLLFKWNMVLRNLHTFIEKRKTGEHFGTIFPLDVIIAKDTFQHSLDSCCLYLDCIEH